MKGFLEGNELHRAGNAFLGLLFPESIYCIGCGAIIDKTRTYCLCDNCIAKFRFANGKTCVQCGRVLNDDYPHLLCNACVDAEYEFERGYTCMMYGLYEKEMVRAFKYHDRSYYARAFGEMMYDRIVYEDLDIDIVVPVPLHPKKLKKRGYNQAALIAKELAKRLGKPMEELLVRTVYTKPMSKIEKDQRSENLMREVPGQRPKQRNLLSAETGLQKHNDEPHRENVFAVLPHKRSICKGNRILLIDDIFTTGATANACASALKEAGASGVILYTLAAPGNPPPKEDVD